MEPSKKANPFEVTLKSAYEKCKETGERVFIAEIHKGAGVRFFSEWYTGELLSIFNIPLKVGVDSEAKTDRCHGVYVELINV